MSPSGDDREPIELPRPADVSGTLAEALARLHPIVGPRALIGGVALAVYGIERYTKDVDLAVTVAQSGAVETQLADADPRPLTIGGVSIATSTGMRVDLTDHRFQYRALYEEAIDVAVKSGPKIRAGDQEICAVTREYLLAMKMAADRPKDELDLAAMLDDPELDYRRARAIVEQHLGPFAARRLDRLGRSAGRTEAPADYADGTGRTS